MNEEQKMDKADLVWDIFWKDQKKNVFDKIKNRLHQIGTEVSLLDCSCAGDNMTVEVETTIMTSQDIKAIEDYAVIEYITYWDFKKHLIVSLRIKIDSPDKKTYTIYVNDGYNLITTDEKEFQERLSNLNKLKSAFNSDIVIRVEVKE